MVTTRAEDQQTCLKLYGHIGLDSTESSYLINQGLRTPSAIINALIGAHIDKLICDKFTIGASIQFETLAKYLLWYRNQHGSLQGISENFSKEAFELFDPNKVSIEIPESAKKSTDKAETTVNQDDFKIKISDYPKFSGKHKDWNRFYEKITAIFELQGMKDLSIEDPNHEDKWKKPSYQL